MEEDFVSASRKRSSSDSYFDSRSSCDTVQQKLEESQVSIQPTLERQNQVEYFDSLSYQDDSKEEMSSSTSAKKVKKKRHFSVFHRHKGRNKSELDHKLGESLPTQSVGNYATHLSLENTWSRGNLDPDRRSNSMYSSNTSLESERSSIRDLSDEEMIETLVNPQRSDRSVSDSETGPGAVAGIEYMVNVTLMSGHGLAIRDRTGTSDPYVKFKCPPFKYRSAVIHRNLNPEWNEHFSFRTSHLDVPMSVRVYDHDYGSLDDYMGGQTLDLESYANGEHHMIDLGLVDPMVKNETLGFIRLYVKISPMAEGENSVAAHEDKEKRHNSKVWSSVLTVTLLEGNDLPAMDQNGLSDPYCKFKLGSQKYKSKVRQKTLNPKWMQRFDLRMFDDCSTLHIEVWDRDFPRNDDFIGMCSVDLTSFSRDVTHDFTLPLVNRDSKPEEGQSTVHFKLCITATKVEEDEEHEEQIMAKNYGLLKSFSVKERNIGHLTIKIDKVVDLLQCNCYVLVELGNSCVKTHPVVKTCNPEWDKMFEFTVGDIHDELEITVYKIGSRSNEQLLGKIKIPMHRLKNGCQQFALKDKHCLTRSRGVLYIETELVYNPVRAMVRTINPREHKLLEDEQKFKRKVLMDNIKRVKNLVQTIVSSVQFINSTWSWENKPLSATAFTIFLIVTLFGELWMLLFLGVIVFLYQYLVVFIKKEHLWQNKVSNNIHIISNLPRGVSTDSMGHANEDSDFSDHLDDKHSGLREKFRLFQEILVMVQNVLGYVADMEEGVINLLNWRVPFLSWMAILAFMGGTILFYLVPLRYVVLIWGINKYTKILRNPNYISNTELFDFLSRCPTNRRLQEWHELSLAVHQKLVDTKPQRRRTKKKK